MTKELLRSWTKTDFKLDWFSGTGAGGQHRNKHQNCLRLTHIESGITVVAQNHRERKRNIEDALNRIAPMLVEHYFPKKRRDRVLTDEVVRTYNEVTNRVVDHSSGFKSSWDNLDMNTFIEERKKS